MFQTRDKELPNVLVLNAASHGKFKVNEKISLCILTD